MGVGQRRPRGRPQRRHHRHHVHRHHGIARHHPGSFVSAMSYGVGGPSDRLRRQFWTGMVLTILAVTGFCFLPVISNVFFNSYSSSSTVYVMIAVFCSIMLLSGIFNTLRVYHVYKLQRGATSPQGESDTINQMELGVNSSTTTAVGNIGSQVQGGERSVSVVWTTDQSGAAIAPPPAYDTLGQVQPALGYPDTPQTTADRTQFYQLQPTNLPTGQINTPSPDNNIPPPPSYEEATKMWAVQ